MIRSYDEAMKEFLTISMVTRSRRKLQVPIVGPVPPHRAFARMRDLISDDPRAIKDDKFIPLPFISFSRHTPEYANDRDQRARLRNLGYKDGGNIVYAADRFTPWDIPYQVDIWTEYVDDAVFIVEGYMRRWRDPIHRIEVWHGEPYGFTKVGIHKPDLVDNSDLEPEDTDRLTRFSLTMVVEGYLTFPADEVKSVRRVDIVGQLNSTPNSDPDANVEIESGVEQSTQSVLMSQTIDEHSL